jgi:hypothetical protein
MDRLENLRLSIALTHPDGEIRLTLRLAARAHDLGPELKCPTHLAAPVQHIDVSPVLRPGQDLLQRIAESVIVRFARIDESAPNVLS